ncbi:1146_t:CDS:1, partial [Paraglomus occultum]
MASVHKLRDLQPIEAATPLALFLRYRHEALSSATMIFQFRNLRRPSRLNRRPPNHSLQRNFVRNSLM